MAKAIGLITANYSTKFPSPLTDSRPAASIPFLGRYRAVDFALSNMVNCGIRTVGMIMPYNYRSLIDHVGSGREWELTRKGGGLFILPGSAFGTSRTGSRFLLRDLSHNKVFLERDSADIVAVSTCNWVYNVDYNEVFEAHAASGADITVLTQTDRYITYYYHTYDYGGGAHGYTTEVGFTFRKSDGRQIPLIADTESPQLASLIKEGVRGFFSGDAEKPYTDEELLECLFIEEVSDDGDRFIGFSLTSYLLIIHYNLCMENLLINTFVEIIRDGTDKHSLCKCGNFAGRNQAVHLRIDRGGCVLTVNRHRLPFL